ERRHYPRDASCLPSRRPQGDREGDAEPAGGISETACLAGASGNESRAQPRRRGSTTFLRFSRSCRLVWSALRLVHRRIIGHASCRRSAIRYASCPGYVKPSSRGKRTSLRNALAQLCNLRTLEARTSCWLTY